MGAIALMSDIAAAQRLPLRAAAFSSVLEQLNPTDGETVYLHAQRLGQGQDGRVDRKYDSHNVYLCRCLLSGLPLDLEFNVRARPKFFKWQPFSCNMN